MKQHSLSAVHEKDLINLLEELNLKKDFEKGIIRCFFCNKIITTFSFQCVFMDGEIIKFSCNNLACYEKALEISIGVSDV